MRWDNEFDDENNVRWMAYSATHDGGSPFQWIARPVLRNTQVIWTLDNSDSELVDACDDEQFATADAAKDHAEKIERELIDWESRQEQFAPEEPESNAVDSPEDVLQAYEHLVGVLRTLSPKCEASESLMGVVLQVSHMVASYHHSDPYTLEWLTEEFGFSRVDGIGFCKRIGPDWIDASHFLRLDCTEAAPDETTWTLLSRMKGIVEASTLPGVFATKGSVRRLVEGVFGFSKYRRFDAGGTA